MPKPLFQPLRGFALLCLLIPACNRIEDRVEITESREVSKFAQPPLNGATSDERFIPALRELGLIDKPAAQQAPPPASAFREFLDWTAPEGWTDAGEDPMGMRMVDFRFGPAKEGECYISLMPGSAGGKEANLNRWRKQMGQPDFTAEEIAALPEKPFFNRTGTYAAFDGEFKKMGAAEAQKGYRLIGLIHSAPQATIFVKMTGPKDLVESQAAAFDQFCQSIRPRQ
ncbi:MAG: hypothetical protein H7A55_07825 [Verrucomicrobiaceae bacterium]|nr:hypothetical protein [Verrucomicrobiaceae bacterium]